MQIMKHTDHEACRSWNIRILKHTDREHTDHDTYRSW